MEKECYNSDNVSLPKNWTNYNSKIINKKRLILGYENK